MSDVYGRVGVRFIHPIEFVEPQDDLDVVLRSPDPMFSERGNQTHGGDTMSVRVEKNPDAFKVQEL